MQYLQCIHILYFVLKFIYVRTVWCIDARIGEPFRVLLLQLSTTLLLFIIANRLKIQVESQQHPAAPFNSD